MPQATAHHRAPAPLFDRFPVRVEHRSSQAGAVLLLVLLMPMLTLLIAPAALVIVLAPQDVAVAVDHHPALAALLAMGIAMSAALFLVPVKRIVMRFGRRRRVTITRDRVMVADANLFAATRWSVPLAEFDGIARHVRTTLSGVRHELVLVHPTRARSIILHYAVHGIDHLTVKRIAHLLRLPELAPGALYRQPSRAAPATAVAELPEAQPA
jgi:hypothetical protein